MSIVHVPFYPSDWLSGTRCLSDSETGVYITLIAQMYHMAGPIERDDERLSRLCGSKSKASFVKVLNYLISQGKITEVNGTLFNDRVEKEIKKLIEKSATCKAAAKARWSKKSNEINGVSDADAMRTHMRNACQSEPEPELYKEKEDTNVSSKKKNLRKGSRISSDWQLPKDWGDWAISEGMDELGVRREADKFLDYWLSVPGQKGVKLNWHSTWRNWIRRAVENRGQAKGGKPQDGDVRDFDGVRKVYHPYSGWVREYA